jgi:hypothetical protein
MMTSSETRGFADFVRTFLLHPGQCLSGLHSRSELLPGQRKLILEATLSQEPHAGVLRGEELTLPGDLKPFVEGGGRGKVQATQ